MNTDAKVFRSFLMRVNLIRRIQNAVAWLRRAGRKAGPQGFGEFLEEASEAHLERLEAKFNKRRPFVEMENRPRPGTGPIPKKEKVRSDDNGK